MARGHRQFMDGESAYHRADRRGAFSIVTYSLEFVETAVMLPITLQTLSSH
ncbi:hypothetical protein O9929_23640 [Vibrio lentus]|nr:hypothetical protein [Vibrio lentus]